MATKLFSAEVEKRALFTLCRAAPAVKQKLIAGLTPEHFSTDVGAEAFQRYMVIWKKKSKAMTWRDLLEDPALSSRTRAALKAYGGVAPKTTKTAQQLLDRVEEYRKLRGLKKLVRLVSEELLQDGIDSEDVLSKVVSHVASLHVVNGGASLMTVGGKTETGSKFLERLLKGEVMSFLPTGFRAFDDRNHGILWGSLLTIAGASGHGKSFIVQTMARNFALQGVKVLMAALEMDNINLLQREMASHTGLALTKLLNPKRTLTSKDKDRVRLEYKRFNARLRKVRGELAYYASEEDTRLETILNYAKTGGYRVLVIDYIGLLAGTDGDDQVKALGRIARQCKTWAGANNAIVVLAAQLKEDGSGIAYSSAIKQHSPNLWTFNRSPQDIEMGILRLVPTKSRMQEPFPFELRFDPSVALVRDLTAEERKQLVKLNDAQTQRSGAPRKGDKKATKSKYFADIA